MRNKVNVSMKISWLTLCNFLRVLSTLFPCLPRPRNEFPSVKKAGFFALNKNISKYCCQSDLELYKMNNVMAHNKVATANYNK